MRDAVKPFIEAAPKALADFLNKTVTLRVLADTKIAFVRYCLDNGFVEKMDGVTTLGGELIKSLFEGVIEMLGNVMKDVPAFLQAHGVTEDQVMLGPKVGLNAGNQAKYKAGKLTVAELLRTQPAVILRNNND